MLQEALQSDPHDPRQQIRLRSRQSHLQVRESVHHHQKTKNMKKNEKYHYEERKN